MSTTSPFSAAPPPRSSNLIVPATQNTAPVIKFRCLYTHDMRRKAKRWQDGFLRYHTFNKRVMVFDNSGYFIGDLHWRQDEGIQDGDELELDKGVLIQVCEPMERTETDLSSLYKNKSQGSPARPGEPQSSAVRLSTAIRSSAASQQPTRSLNDLLGIKKTPTTQILSPYEERQRQRQAPGRQQAFERPGPAKRQRTVSPERDHHRPRDLQPETIDLSSLPSRATRVLSSANLSTSTQPPRASNDLNPGRFTPVTSSSSVTAATTVTAKRQDRTTRANAPTIPPHIVQSTSSESPTVNPAPGTGTGNLANPLQLSVERPRRKLMYQAVLPRQASTPKPPQPPSQPEDNAAVRHRVNATNTLSPSDVDLIILDGIEDVTDFNPAPSANNTKEPRRLSSPKAPKSSNSGPLDPSQNNNTVYCQPQNSSCQKSIRPCRIESKQSTSVEPTPLPKKSTSVPSLSVPVNNEKPPKKPRALGLRKAYSDPSTINSLHSRALSNSTTPLNPILEQDRVHEQGPWTSEALDLFDFWPPGRPKPS